VVWGFFSKSNDINATLRVLREPSDDQEEAKEEEEEMLHDAALGKVESRGGSLEVPAGSDVRVSLVFDNKFSWMRGKTIQYYICFVSQDDHVHIDNPKHGKLAQFQHKKNAQAH